MIKLFTLNLALHPKDLYKSLHVEKICKLVIKFHLDDFTEQEKLHVNLIDVPFHYESRNLSKVF